MDPLPPDPYAALGVSKDASPATIKSTYRKLALTCHPDKVKDESLKPQKQEEFHKIQAAYELIGDEEKRATYDAQVRLDKLRSEKAARNTAADVDIKTTGYKVRTEAPKGATYTTHGPHRYEERKPARAYDDDRYFEDRSSSRKYPTYEQYPKHTSSSSRTARPEREREPIRVAKPTDRTRSDRAKTRDRQERSDRSGKNAYMEEDSSNDERARYEAEYRRRSEEDRRKRDEEDAKEAARKEAASARKKAEDRRSYDEPKEPRRHHSDEGNFDRTQRKMSEATGDAIKHIYRTSLEPDPRPSPGRSSSSREVPRERVDSYSRRPEAVRRSSAAPRKDRPQPSGRDRKGYPEIVEWEEDRPSRAPPSFTQSKSSPADIQLPPTLGRSYTEAPRDRNHETSPTPPTYRRADTLPTMPSASSSRRKDATVTRPSGLRAAESAGAREAEEYPTVPPARNSSSTKYYYPTSGGGVSLLQEHVDVANGNGRRTVLAEPSRHRNRSPEPISRPPMGVNRPPDKTASQSRSASSTFPPPPLGRSSTFNEGTERGRSDRLYGEISSDYLKREAPRRENINYARKVGPEDIQWAGGREPDKNISSRDYPSKPGISRHPTYVY